MNVVPEASFSAVDIGRVGIGAEQSLEPCRWVSETTIIDRWPSQSAAVQAMANQSAIAKHFGGPMPADVVADANNEASNWTVLERLPSWPAAMITYHPDAGAVAIGIGESLRDLHQLDIEVANELELVGSGGWDLLAEQVRARIRSEDFDQSRIREPYSRYGPDQLLEMFESGRPAEDEEVVTHGSYTPANALFNGGTAAGFVGLSAMRVIDRHFDLAQMHLAVNEQLGPEAVFGFYDGYGADPSLIAIDHYVFAHNLLMS